MKVSRRNSTPASEKGRKRKAAADDNNMPKKSKKEPTASSLSSSSDEDLRVNGSRPKPPPTGAKKALPKAPAKGKAKKWVVSSAALSLLALQLLWAVPIGSGSGLFRGHEKTKLMKSLPKLTQYKVWFVPRPRDLT